MLNFLGMISLILNSNIVKLYKSNTIVPINLICVYRSPGTDIENVINSLREIIDGLKSNNDLTLGNYRWFEC